jgi:hypothetical protein
VRVLLKGKDIKSGSALLFAIAPHSAARKTSDERTVGKKTLQNTKEEATKIRVGGYFSSTSAAMSVSVNRLAIRGTSSVKGGVGKKCDDVAEGSIASATS